MSFEMDIPLLTEAEMKEADDLVNGIVAVSNAVFGLLGAYCGYGADPSKLDRRVAEYLDAHPELRDVIRQQVHELVEEVLA